MVILNHLNASDPLGKKALKFSWWCNITSHPFATSAALRTPPVGKD